MWLYDKKGVRSAELLRYFQRYGQHQLFRFSMTNRSVQGSYADEGQTYLNSFQRHGKKIKFLWFLRQAAFVLHLTRRWRRVAEVWAVGWGYLAAWQFLEAFPLFNYKFITYKRKAGTRRSRYSGYYKYLWAKERRLVSGTRFDQFQFYLFAPTLMERINFSFWYLTNRNFENEILDLFKEIGERAVEGSHFWHYQQVKGLVGIDLLQIYYLLRRLKFFKMRFNTIEKVEEELNLSELTGWYFRRVFFVHSWRWQLRRGRGAWKRLNVKVFFYCILLIFVYFSDCSWFIIL